MSWWNLFPTCDQCNSGEKRGRWSCLIVRPDLEPVEEFFDFDPSTGRLEAAYGLPRAVRARVRLTIRVLGLNRLDRQQARKNTERELKNAYTAGDAERVQQMLTDGQYRFVTRRAVQVCRALNENSF